MLNQKTMHLLLLFLSLLFIGCGNSKIIEVPKLITELKIEKQVIPGELLECMPLPKEREINMQSDVATLIIELTETAADCKNKLESVKELVN